MTDCLLVDLLLIAVLIEVFLAFFFQRWIFRRFDFINSEFDRLWNVISRIDNEVADISNRNSAGSSDGRKTMSTGNEFEKPEEGSHKCMR